MHLVHLASTISPVAPLADVRDLSRERVVEDQPKRDHSEQGAVCAGRVDRGARRRYRHLDAVAEEVGVPIEIST